MRVTSGLAWTLMAMVVLGYPAATVVWAQALQSSGELPVDADSIDIPIGMSVIMTVFLGPIALGLSWLCLRRLDPATRWTAWRRDRRWWSIGATLLLGTPALAMADLAFRNAASIWASDWPRYESVWAAWSGIVAVWLLALRAAAIGQAPARDAPCREDGIDG